MEKKIQQILSRILINSLKSLDIDKVSRQELSQDLCLDLPKDNRFGDISTSIALRLSRKMKRPPLEIAQNLADSINKDLGKGPHKDYIRQVKVEGAGFINFYLSDKYFYDQLKGVISKGKHFFKANLGCGRAVLVEFVSANPTGPLSVAHARQAAVGDILANILDFVGYKVKREYYLNDEGNQINILGRSIELRLKELNGERIEFPEDHYQGEYIYDMARQIKDKNLNVRDFSEYGVKQILDIIKKELDDFGVQFNYWYSQKSLRTSGKIQKAFDFLKKKKFLYEQDGALWFKSTQLGDDKDRVVIKSDSSYTYLAPDIAYHQDKYRRGFKWLINLWGPDHHGYIPRLKAAVEALGHNKDSLSVIIVQLATIFRDGKPVQMSTRRGQYITLREVLDEVGRDASRFFFIMRRTNSHLDFDLAVAKKETSENPVYYIQYAHARISSILRNSAVKVDLRALDFRLLKEKEEIALIKKLWQFFYILYICYKTIDPYMLTVYLQEVSEAFHKFYDLHRVLGEDPKLTQARLALIDATRIVIATGLELIGVSTPEKM